MCSLSASPVPTPEREAALEQDRGGGGGLGDDRRVDADGRAGHGRRDLHVTVTWAIAPIIDQTKELWPCSSFQGWKWSEIHRSVEPGLLGHPGLLDQLAGSNSSLDRK